VTTQSKAEALVAAILEGEDPKDFIQRHLPDIERKQGIKRVAEYELEDIGIEHSQYFTGRGTSHTNWDDVYVGIGDNPSEAIDDALEAAAVSGWLINDIDTSAWPETPSVSDHLKHEAMGAAAEQIDRAEYDDDEADYLAAVEERAEEIMSEGDSELYYHAAVWLRAPGPGEAHFTVSEAEDPKDFLKRISKGPDRPSGWPQFSRWTGARWGMDTRRAFHMIKRHHIMRNPDGSIARDAEGQAIYEPYDQRHWLKATKFGRDRERFTHQVIYYNTSILSWDRYGNIIVDDGGRKSITTRNRINTFLPHGWRIHTFQNIWYWFCHEWPENIRERIWSDQRARRRPGFPWWIEYNQYDMLRPDGTLIFGSDQKPQDKKGRADPTGRLKLEAWVDMRPPPGGVLHPPRRGRHNAYDPNQLQFQLEGKYMRQLARWKRIKAKHHRLKEVKKLEREVEKVDKPSDKKKPKKGHQNLR